MPVKFLTLLALSLHAFAASAQSFYDIDQVQEIKLTFFQINWDAKLDSLKAVNEEAYLLAKSVEINGETFDSVGVKYKGNSTYKATNAKNPMHIELDYVRPDQNYKGLKDIKLGNGYYDATFVREALGYEILRKYMAAPKANFAKLYIGGVYYGVYSNQQSINKSFVREHFGTTGQNPFFKCNPQTVGGPGGSGYSDLVYSSADSTAYYKKYERKSDYGWRQLLNLMDTLKNRPNSAHKMVDIDRALWMHAFNAVTVNLDSYTGAFGQNYYLYQDDQGRFLPVVWDLNMCFGSFPALTSGNLSTAQMQSLDPLTQATNTTRPLISKLLANATYKRMYLAHVRTLFQENFADSTYRKRALEMQAVIAADVLADNKKFYTNAQFTSNIDNALSGSGGGFNNPPGITQLMNARYNYLKNNTNFTAVAPTLSVPAFSPAVPVSGATVQVTASIQDAVSVWVGTRASVGDVFQRSPMYDDGLHNDGVAADGIYGGTFTAGAARTQIYLYAENAKSGRFLPERAEYEFIDLPSALPLPNPGDVVINEILASNTNGATDENGQYEDWVELYNKTAQAQNLFGLYLTDKASNPDKWEFPNGTFIPASGFLIVWADEDSSQGPLHANFKLSAGGEFVMLSNGASVVYDSISFGPQQPDISFGRFPNGTGGFVTMPTTFGKTNSLSSSTGEAGAEAIALRVFPNPATAELVLRSGEAALRDLAVYDLSGRIFYQQIFDSPTAEHRIAVADWPDGTYFVRVNGAMAITFLKL